MRSEKDPVSNQPQDSIDEEDERYQRAKKLDPGLPKPGEEIDVNLKKFALVLGAILVFAAIASAITKF